MVIQDRYHRQRLVDGFGDEGQCALSKSCVAIVGVGALGCMSASFLARAGVGKIVLVDRDIVELTNLQRQSLFTEEDAREQKPKAIVAKDHLQAMNSEIEIIAHVEDLQAQNIERLLENVDVIVDGLDNFQTRYLLNDFAVRESIPYMFAGVIAGMGNVMTILPKNQTTPCLRCLFLEPPDPQLEETCDTVGVLSPAIGIAASCQTMDVLKFLTGNQDKISKTLLTFDLWNSQSNRLEHGDPRDGCPCCDHRNFEYLDNAKSPQPTFLCGKTVVQIPSSGSLNLQSINERLREFGTFECNEFLVRGTLSEEKTIWGIIFN